MRTFLLKNNGDISGIKNLIELKKDTLLVGRGLGNPDYHALVARQPTPEKLQEIHDQWVKEFNEKGSSDDTDWQFPPPTLPGNKDIVPVLSSGELREEGKKMHHCVACYKGRISNGNSYLYKVLAPERATLELILDAGITPQIGQLKLAFNREPSAKTKSVVDQWLRESRLARG